MKIRTLLLLAFCLAFLLFPQQMNGQNPVDLMSIGRSLPLVSRAELEESLAWHQMFADSIGVKEKVREQALEAIEYIQSRLELGDFRPGDQIVFFVEGEEAFPDTLVVEGGPSVLIPNAGTVSLEGILRSELQGHLSEELSRFLRNPTVRVRPTIRLTMDGLFGQPGFYTFPADLPIGEAIMRAGGPTGEARMGAIKIKREGMTLFGGDEVNQAIAQGRTFDQLGLRPGDEINIPEKILTVRRVLTWGVGAASFLLLGMRFYGG
ncbi:MAG: polysaccharide biosynthesis/export family protein [Gemmatimonadota bacterium]